MGEYADMAVDDMLNGHWEDDDSDFEPSDGFRFPRHDRRRKKVLSCSVCGAKPLFWLEEDGKWYLGDFDEEDDEIRHVCKLKKRFNNVRFSG
jgi:hypothetical protein